MKVVLVVWKDIVGQFGWYTQNQLDKFITDQEEGIVHQVGFLYEEDEDQVVLLDSYFLRKDQFGTMHKIPRGCIISIKEIKSKSDKEPTPESGKALKR